MVPGLLATGLLATLLSACSPPRITPDETRRLLEGAEFFSRRTTVTLTLFRNDYLGESFLRREHPANEVFLDLGLVAIEPGGALGAKYALTPLGEQRRQQEDWKARASGYSGVEAWDVVVAKRALVDFGLPNLYRDGSVETSFRWRDEPNEIGRRLGLDTEPRSGVAVLRFAGKDWRLESIR